MKQRSTGALILGLSACGFPLTQLVIRKWGTRGALLSEAVCAGLAVRDATMVASGVPGRLRRGPAAMLWLELGVALAATVAGAPLALGWKPSPAHPVEITRRAAVGTLFGLHTARFAIYLRADQGRRERAA